MLVVAVIGISIGAFLAVLGMALYMTTDWPDL